MAMMLATANDAPATPGEPQQRGNDAERESAERDLNDLLQGCRRGAAPGKSRDHEGGGEQAQRHLLARRGSRHRSTSGTARNPSGRASSWARMSKVTVSGPGVSSRSQ